MKLRSRPIHAWTLLPLIFLLLLAACSSSPKPAAKPAPAPVQTVEADKPPAEDPAAAVEEVPPPAGGDIQAQPVRTEPAEKDPAVLLEDAFAAYEEALSALESDDVDAGLAHCRGQSRPRPTQGWPTSYQLPAFSYQLRASRS